MEETLDSGENACNPTIPDELPEDFEKMKGDAIGDTLYSERSVLKILIKLNEIYTIEWNEATESELCLLWDMTLEKDVVRFIMEHDFLDISLQIIRDTNNVRLMEILVGILGNSCCVEEFRNSFPEAALDVLVEQLFAVKPDPLTIVQFVRLLTSLAWNLHPWIKNPNNLKLLSANAAFVFKSSTNEELLLSSLELVSSLCNQTVDAVDYSSFFCSAEIVDGLVECWRQILPDWKGEDDFPSKVYYKAANNWAHILASLITQPSGRIYICEKGEVIGNILKLFCLRSEAEDSVFLASVAVLESLLRVYFSTSAFVNILKVYHTVTQYAGEMEELDPETNFSISLLIETIENFCVSVAMSIDKTVLQETLTHCNENHVLLFWKCINERQPDVEADERTV